MELYFLRHGIAEDLDGIKIKVDSDRPLTAEGKSKIKDIARAFHKMELDFEIILSSPYLRARQTAEIVAETYRGKSKINFSENLIPSGNTKDLFREISERYRAVSSLLLVGHEPNMSCTISSLLSGHPQLFIQVKKGGFCHLNLDWQTKGPQQAVLKTLMTSKQLRLIHQ